MRRRLALLVLVLVAFGTPAFAHVAVAPDEAERGSTGTFTFTVPNEEDNAKTAKIEIFWPDNAKFTTVELTIPDGWTADEASKSVTFNGTLAGEEKVALSMKLGPLPVDGDSAVFKVLQTYDNGEVVRWIDVQAGSEEPPHPAAVVKLTGVAPTTTTAVADVAAPTTAAPTTAAPTSDGGDGASGASVVFVLLATFFAAVGVGIGFAVWRRSRAR